MAWKFTKIDENSIMDKQKVLEISRMQKKEKKTKKRKKNRVLENLFFQKRDF